MTNNNQSEGYIKNRCKKLGIVNFSSFRDRIYDAIDKLDLGDDYPDESTIRRWYKGEVNPKRSNIDIIAEALDSTPSEIINGKDDPVAQDLKKMKQLYQSSEQEVEMMRKVLVFQKGSLGYLAILLLSIGCIFLDINFFHVGFVAIIALIVATILIVKDEKKSKQEMITENIDQVSIPKAFKEFIKMYRDGNLVMRIGLLYIIIILIVAMLPLAELIFYRGTYYISCFLYLALGIGLLIIDIRKR